jgi:LCP family protein required for cell wall assembly
MNKLRNLFKSKLSIDATAAGLALLALFGAAFAVSALLIYGVNRAGSGGPGGIFQPGGDGGTTDPLAVEGLPGPDTSVNLEAWDGAGRVNVLVMGLDYRDWSSGEGPSRTDTMILLTLDPLTGTAGILSIPRDLWVSIPGFDNNRINTAYFLGESYDLPGGGPGLASATVEALLGVPIHYYAQIDFTAFIRFIDEIGGVKIDVPEQIKVDPLGEGNTKVLKPGIQTLDGALTLAYARARNTPGGDFDRAQRQQQVMMAIRDRVLSVGNLPSLITRAPQLYQDLSGGVRTNLGFEEILQLALLVAEIDEADIQRGAIGIDHTLFANTAEGASVLIPLSEKIRGLRDSLFSNTGALGPLTPGSAEERMAAEGIRLAVLNGSSTSGLAADTAEFLTGRGAQVVEVGNADGLYAATTLIDYTGSPHTLKYLYDLFGVLPERVFFEYDPNSSVDLLLILGEDADPGVLGQ